MCHEGRVPSILRDLLSPRDPSPGADRRGQVLVPCPTGSDSSLTLGNPPAPAAQALGYLLHLLTPPSDQQFHVTAWLGGAGGDGKDKQWWTPVSLGGDQDEDWQG